MRRRRLGLVSWTLIILVLLFAGWKAAIFLTNQGSANGSLASTDSLQAKAPISVTNSRVADEENTPISNNNSLHLLTGSLDTKGVQPAALVAFAKTKIGVPYQYGSTDPDVGFDCSGFVTHVFSHFDILVPRSSIDFTHVGEEVSAAAARPGDLILFTGTDSTDRFVGHMGIVVDNSDSLRFIHATSGKQHGVTITPLNGYYKTRYVKTIRVFSNNS